MRKTTLEEWEASFREWIESLRSSGFPQGAWLDLSSNPIISVEHLYSIPSLGAKVSLSDGTICHFDSLHGGGGWRVYQHGRISRMPLVHEFARRNVYLAREWEKDCLSHVKQDNQNAIVHCWEKSDEHMAQAALYVVELLAYMLQE